MKTSAFTLIELSIVLVIIGLVIGSVLVGNDLIDASQTRKVTTQLENYKTATNTFKLKYNCLPGDCDHAVSVGLGTAGGVGDDGNGNSIIGNASTDSLDEMPNYWYHLMRASLIADTVDGSDSGTGYEGLTNPAPIFAYNSSSPASGQLTWLTLYNKSFLNSFFATFNNHSFYTTASVTPGSATAGRSLLPITAFRIDKKIDDGAAEAGSVQAASNTATIPMGVGTPSYGFGATSNACVELATKAYNTTNTNYVAANLCQLVFKAGF